VLVLDAGLSSDPILRHEQQRNRHLAQTERLERYERAVNHRYSSPDGPMFDERGRVLEGQVCGSEEYDYEPGENGYGDT
jgi:hypothetical protein